VNFDTVNASLKFISQVSAVSQPVACIVFNLVYCGTCTDCSTAEAVPVCDPSWWWLCFQPTHNQ